jgi:hypothetical protein
MPALSYILHRAGAQAEMSKSKSKKPELFKGDLVYSSLRTAESNKPGLNVHFTLRFGEQRFHVQKLGYTALDLFVGVRHAFLNFSLEDCSMPDEDWAIDPPIETNREVSRVVGASKANSAQSEDASKASLGVKVAGGAIPTGELTSTGEVAISEARESKSTEEISDEFERTISFVTARGGPDNPSWDIRPPSDELILRGALFKDQRFSRVVLTGDKPQAVVSLEIPKDGLVIKDETGAYNSLPNKLGLTRMLLTRAFCKDPLLLIATQFGEADDEQ